jgi:hypothetical protein
VRLYLQHCTSSIGITIVSTVSTHVSYIPRFGIVPYPPSSSLYVRAKFGNPSQQAHHSAKVSSSLTYLVLRLGGKAYQYQPEHVLLQVLSSVLFSAMRCDLLPSYLARGTLLESPHIDPVPVWAYWPDPLTDPEGM